MSDELTIINRDMAGHINPAHNIYIPAGELPRELEAAKARILKLQQTKAAYEHGITLAEDAIREAHAKDAKARELAATKGEVFAGSPAVDKAIAHRQDLIEMVSTVEAKILAEIK